MAAFGLRLGGSFCLRLHKTLLEAVCVSVDLHEFLPLELRRVFSRLIRAQGVKPEAAFVSAVSVAVGETLDVYVFVGCDQGAFGTVSGLHGIARCVQDFLREHFQTLLPENQADLVSALVVQWEPNLLAIK
ncbi:E4 ORFA [Equine adenovirus 1]|uniref:E4 ORFA n=1 Tax=Equine adenovirus A serotype 1 TaxID=46916 RepID=G5CZA1_ADEE1|nr:E4 ORFA [Equine adenovirus 1]AEP16432.1 E4 ORFA [Equine adenovirus 1]